MAASTKYTKERSTFPKFKFQNSREAAAALACEQNASELCIEDMPQASQRTYVLLQEETTAR
jgi:hypothetical protein